MSDSKTKILRGLLAGVLILASAGVIFSISPPHASSDGGNCLAPPKGLANFEPTVPPATVPVIGFFRDDGGEATLTDYAGRGLVLNFWATWCAPCVREMPQLNKLKQLADDAGFDVITVSEDRDGPPVINEFYATNKLDKLEVLYDKKMRLLDAFRVRGLPTTILIDSQSREVGRAEGPAEWDQPEILSFIKRCVGKIK